MAFKMVLTTVLTALLMMDDDIDDGIDDRHGAGDNDNEGDSGLWLRGKLTQSTKLRALFVWSRDSLEVVSKLRLQHFYLAIQTTGLLIMTTTYAEYIYSAKYYHIHK